MIRQIEFHAMGCQMMAAHDNASPRAAGRLDQVPQWFEGWEQTLSRFRQDSELNQFNNCPGIDWQASPTLWQVFKLALEAEKFSGGLVTPLVLEAILEAGYTDSFERLPAILEKPIQTIPSVQPLSLVTFNESAHTIRLPVGARLDFGGSAKGWAAHQALRLLRGYGPSLVDAGGDIAVSGLQTRGEAWQIGVADPFRPGNNLLVLGVGRCGIATSGRDYRRWVSGGRLQHHLIDPRTGQPAVTDVLTATVIAPDILQAEAAAKTALILGSQDGLAWLAARPTLAGLLVLEDGQQRASRKFDQYVL